MGDAVETSGFFDYADETGHEEDKEVDVAVILFCWRIVGFVEDRLEMDHNDIWNERFLFA